MRSDICIVGVCIIGLVGCVAKSPTQGKLDGRVVKAFGGAETFGPLDNPVKVEAFRVKNRVFESQEEVDNPGPLGGYPIVSGPVEVDAKVASEFYDVLRDQKSYEWEMVKACEFDPGVAIRFTGKNDVTEVIICFLCGQLVVVHGGKRYSLPDLGSSQLKLLKLVQRIFPNYKEIQGLVIEE